MDSSRSDSGRCDWLQEHRQKVLEKVKVDRYIGKLGGSCKVGSYVSEKPGWAL